MALCMRCLRGLGLHQLQRQKDRYAAHCRQVSRLPQACCKSSRECAGLSSSDHHARSTATSAMPDATKYAPPPISHTSQPKSTRVTTAKPCVSIDEKLCASAAMSSGAQLAMKCMMPK